MGDSLKWAYDQEQDEIRRNRQKRAAEIRQEIASEWDDWSLDKMEMVKIISDLEYGEEEGALKHLENREDIQRFFMFIKKLGWDQI